MKRNPPLTKIRTRNPSRPRGVLMASLQHPTHHPEERKKKVVFLVSRQPRPSTSCFPRMPRRQPPPFHVATSGSRSESSAQASRTSVLWRTCESADFPPQTVHSVKIKTKQLAPSKPSVSPVRFEEQGLAKPITPQARSGGQSSTVPKPPHGCWVC